MLYIPPCHAIPDDDYLVREALAFVRPPESLLSRLAQRPLILFRSIITPNREVIRFLELAKSIGRQPLFLEYSNDRFFPSVNPTKRRLAKLHIETVRGLTQNIAVVTFNDANGKRFRDVQCRNGVSLIDFHHSMVREIIGECVLHSIYDANEFLGEDSCHTNYERLFALFTCLGMQAESYFTEGQEESFSKDVIAPAFEKTVARFGVPPLITRLLPEEVRVNPAWEYYPSAILPFAKQAAKEARR